MPDLRRSVVALVQVSTDEIQPFFGERKRTGLFFFFGGGFIAQRTREDGDEKGRICALRGDPFDPVTHPVKASAEIRFFIKFKMIKTIPFNHMFTIKNSRTDCNGNVEENKHE